jgi:hypothetical protein
MTLMEELGGEDESSGVMESSNSAGRLGGSVKSIEPVDKAGEKTSSWSDSDIWPKLILSSGCVRLPVWLVGERSLKLRPSAEEIRATEWLCSKPLGWAFVGHSRRLSF